MVFMVSEPFTRPLYSPVCVRHHNYVCISIIWTIFIRIHLYIYYNYIYYLLTYYYLQSAMTHYAQTGRLSKISCR